MQGKNSHFAQQSENSYFAQDSSGIVPIPTLRRTYTPFLLGNGYDCLIFTING